MVSKLLAMQQSKYYTIYQYLYLGVTTKGQTVKESLGELEELSQKSDNEALHQNLADVRSIFEDIIADGILDNDSPMAQSVILIKLEFRLYEKTNDDSDDAPDDIITSTRN